MEQQLWIVDSAEDEVIKEDLPERKTSVKWITASSTRSWRASQKMNFVRYLQWTHFCCQGGKVRSCVSGMNPINYQSGDIDVAPVVLFESVDERLNTDSPAVDVLIIFSYLLFIYWRWWCYSARDDNGGNDYYNRDYDVDNDFFALFCW